MRAENTPFELADADLFVSEGSRGLQVRDAKQRVRISLTLDGERPKLLLIGEEGEVLFKAP